MFVSIVGGMALLIYAPWIVALAMGGMLIAATWFAGIAEGRRQPRNAEIWRRQLWDLYQRERAATHEALIAQVHRDRRRLEEALVELEIVRRQEAVIENALNPPAVEIPDDGWPRTPTKGC